MSTQPKDIRKLNSRASGTGDVPFRVTNPEQIPVQRYYDEAFYKLEGERVWLRTWQMACRLEEIPEVGDWVEYKILDKSVIVVRAADGVKAFHNACRHRGMKVAKGRGNNKKQGGFVCSFHGWKYDLGGKNRFVYGRHKFSEESLDPTQLDLRPCRVELWGGCAFINFDNDALPFIDHIGPSAERCDLRNVADMKVEWWSSTILPVNWKLAMEAFMEGYHLAKTHPQLQAASTPASAMRYGTPPDAVPTSRASLGARDMIDVSINHMELLSEGMGGMIHKNDIAIARDIRDRTWPDDPAEAMKEFYRTLNEEITARGRARGVPMPDFNALAHIKTAQPVEFIFPNYFMLVQFGNMSSYRIRPLGPESCLFELWALTLVPQDEPRPPLVEPTPSPLTDPCWPMIPKQDYDNLPGQQEGLHASGFEYMRLSHEVEGTISNYHRLIDGYLGAVDREALAKGSTIASSPLDMPIADIGF